MSWATAERRWVATGCEGTVARYAGKRSGLGDPERLTGSGGAGYGPAMSQPSDLPPADSLGGPDGDEVSLRIDAPPERLYELVTDIEHMGRLSPECTGGRWLEGSVSPAVGARFTGTNKRGIARWSTTNTVVSAEPDRVFAFETNQSGTRWRYELIPDGDATVVTESREEFAPRSLVARVFATVALGGIGSHDDEMRTGMRATLDRLKALAEAG